MLKLNTLSGFGSGVSAGGAAGFTVGYCGGGISTSLVELLTIEGIDYATDINTARTDADMNDERRQPSHFSNGSTKGMWIGGRELDNNAISAADTTTFATETTAISTDADSGWTIWRCSPLATLTDGYTTGGLAPSNDNRCQKTVFATEVTSANTDGDAAGNVLENGAISGTTVKGYHIGGDGGNTTMYIFTYSTDTVATHTDTMPSTNIGQSGLTDGVTNGYTVAGWQGLSVGFKMVFSTDVYSAHTDGDRTVDAMDTSQNAPSDNGVAGYVQGGQMSGTFHDECDKMTYSTGVVAAVTDADLVVVRAATGGFSTNAV